MAIAPVTTIAAQATTPTSATRRSQRGATGAPRPRAALHASNATTTESATTTSASRKCDMTASGWRSRITVIPPSGICATVPRNAASATLTTHRGSPATRREACQVASDARIPPTAMTRFPNSTIGWKLRAGNGVEPQRGQLSQPRPDPVSRTKAPDVTTSPSMATVPAARWRKRRDDTGSRTRARRLKTTSPRFPLRPRRRGGGPARPRRTSPRARRACRSAT